VFVESNSTRLNICEVTKFYDIIADAHTGTATHAEKRKHPGKHKRTKCHRNRGDKSSRR